MKKIAAGDFRTNCFAIMDDVHAGRETVVITKRGKPVAKLVPVDEETDDIYNFLAGKGTISGDIVSPALPEYRGHGAGRRTGFAYRRSKTVQTIW